MDPIQREASELIAGDRANSVLTVSEDQVSPRWRLLSGEVDPKNAPRILI